MRGPETVKTSLSVVPPLRSLRFRRGFPVAASTLGR